jgi:hypothetical protein
VDRKWGVIQIPVNKKLAKALIEKYGYEKGKEIYYKMESEGKSTYTKGMKTAEEKGETQKSFPRKAKKRKKAK